MFRQKEQRPYGPRPDDSFFPSPKQVGFIRHAERLSESFRVMGIKSLGITETVIPLAAAASWQRAAAGSMETEVATDSY